MSMWILHPANIKCREIILFNAKNKTNILLRQCPLSQNEGKQPSAIPSEIQTCDMSEISSSFYD